MKEQAQAASSAHISRHETEPGEECNDVGAASDAEILPGEPSVHFASESRSVGAEHSFQAPAPAAAPGAAEPPLKPTVALPPRSPILQLPALRENARPLEEPALASLAYESCADDDFQDCYFPRYN